VRQETEAAIRAARIAQQIADSRKGADAVTFKHGIDIVTAADVACEDAIRTELTRACPDIPVVGEERGGTPRAGAPYWLVDPICGTRCYASNVPLYCTNIALVEDGAVSAAVIGVGKTGELLYAERGAGAWLMPGPDAAPERIVTGEASSTLWVGGRKQPAADLWRHMLELDRWYLWTFTSSVCYAHFAAGRIAGIVHFAYGPDYSDPPVHTAAGCFVAQEAGGVVTDLATGKPWTLDTRAFLLAATPALHGELGRIVATVA
jgi:fructose-1,6-bisphosphatase/inositol monophosphatase family enzyme